MNMRISNKLTKSNLRKMSRVLLSSIFTLAFGLSIALAHITLCENEPCTMNMGQNCSEVLKLELVYGSCCSLSDVKNVDGEDDCLLTVAGNYTECYFRSPDYICTPDFPCYPEWNIIYAYDTGYACPNSKYKTPTVMPDKKNTTSANSTANQESEGNEAVAHKPTTSKVVSNNNQEKLRKKGARGRNRKGGV
jgi:hypothetical protein